MTVLAVGFLLLLFASLYFVGPLLVGTDSVLPIKDAAASAELSGPIGNVLSTVDQSVTMLFSVTVGLAALMGVVVREAAKSAIPIPKYIIALLGFFVGSTVWSCYFAYVCRLRALRLASYSIYPPSHVEELITTLGSLVAVSGALAMLIFYTCYQSGLMKEGTK